MKTFAALGFYANGMTDVEQYGDCVFCGKHNKLYVNIQTGLWSCKAGICGLEGNIYDFVREWYMRQFEITQRRDYQPLADERGIAVLALQRAQLAYDGARWIIPIKNHSGQIVTLRIYPRKNAKLEWLSGQPAYLYGTNILRENIRTVYLCEGEWDAIALDWILNQRSNTLSAALGVPGANVFKRIWARYMTGRNVVICYDNDFAGRRGAQSVFEILQNVAASVSWIEWPEETPDKYDVRDFFKHNGTLKSFRELIRPYTDRSDELAEEARSIGVPRPKPKTQEKREEVSNTGAVAPGDAPEVQSASEILESFPLLSDGDRPTLETILDVYRSHLHMTPDLETGLKVIFAVIYSNQIDGDPLWLHVVSPAASGKSALIMSTGHARQCVPVSRITENTLVSGWQLPGRADPSLIPKLIGKVFVLKDMTEILEMPEAKKKEIYSILRGAYDGEVEKPFGNNIVRKYKGFFSMISGVTQAILAERGATLGERFLHYHMIKGVGWDSSAEVASAIHNVGLESEMRLELSTAACSFLEWRVLPEDIPAIPPRIIKRMIPLAALVAMLRADVARTQYTKELLYRPQHEMGTRVAKQLTKLLLGLGLLRFPPHVTEADYNIVKRVALDSCIGFCRDVVDLLIEHDGLDVMQISKGTNIPLVTLITYIENMGQLGILTKEVIETGDKLLNKQVVCHLTPVIKNYWQDAGIGTIPENAAKNGALSGKKMLIKHRLKPARSLEENR